MLDRVGRWWKGIVAVFVGIAAILTVIDLVLRLGVLSWLGIRVGRLADLLVTHWVGSVLVVFAVSIFVLYVKFRRLEEYVGMSFREDFKEDLNKNWDYNGKWKLVPGGGVSVTQSELGGITKIGHLWKDYSFEFTAVIVNDRIGWIVRAQDLFNCYMIQLTPDMVRPHLRLGGQYIWSLDKGHSLRINLNEPMRIRTEVRGLEVRVYVNDKEAYYNNELFSMKFLPVKPKEDDKEQKVVVPAFTTGRVGFRMAGEEHGRFYQCRVRPL